MSRIAGGLVAPPCGGSYPFSQQAMSSVFSHHRHVRASALCVAAALLSACDRKPIVVEIGQPIPAYQTLNLAGDSVSVASLLGKVVVLNVWATWCAPCREEIPYLQSLYDEHGGAGLTIVGVSVDTRGEDDTIREFMKDFRMTYEIWRDPDERIQSAYLALGVPASYLIDREGILRWKHLGTVRATDTTFTTALRAALADAPVSAALLTR